MRDPDAIDLYLDMLAAERGAAANTLAAYRRDLERAAEALAARSGLLAAGPADLRHYLADRGREGAAPATLARALSALSGFYRFHLEEGVLSADPARGLEAPRRAQPLPDVLTREETARLFEAAEARGDPRLCCLLELLYGAGLRVSECAGLPLDALPQRDPAPGETGGWSWRGRMLGITGKGGRERIVPLGRAALGALAAWLGARDAAAPAQGSRAARFVFPSRAKAGHLTRRRIGQLLRGLAPEAGIAPERLHPHALRHAYATHLVSGGADLRAVQTLLGHADISTTEIYTHLADDELADLLEAAHPLAPGGGRGPGAAPALAASEGSA